MQSHPTQPRRSPTGIRLRHSRSCPAAKDNNARCKCKPAYEASAFSKRDGKQLRKSFPSQAAALAWRTDTLHSIGKGKIVVSSRQTLATTAEEFIDGITRGVILNKRDEPFKPSVRRAYTTDIRKVVLPELGHHRLSEIRRRDVQALVDRLVSEGTSPTRIHGIVMPLRTIFRRAIEREEISVNPTANVRLPAATGTRDRVATIAEFDELLAVLAERDRALWATAFYAGLRRGELRGLKWDDVDWQAGVIQVTRSWDEKEGEIEPKSKKSKRGVPMPTVLRRVLIEHKMATGRDGQALVFGRSADAPFTPSNVRMRAVRAWKAENTERAKKKLPLLVPIGLHECRHSYVTLMYEAGLPLERIGDYVGHSGAFMTERYRHLLDGHEADAVAKFDAFIGATNARTNAHAARRGVSRAVR